MQYLEYLNYILINRISYKSSLKFWVFIVWSFANELLILSWIFLDKMIQIRYFIYLRFWIILFKIFLWLDVTAITTLKFLHFNISNLSWMTVFRLRYVNSCRYRLIIFNAIIVFFFILLNSKINDILFNNSWISIV
jgi:hypothetical protein